MTGIAVVAVGVFFLGIFLLFRRFVGGKRRLPPAQAKALWRNFAAAEAQADLHRRVLDAAKVLEAALKAKGYRGSMADMLRSAGPAIPNVQNVWDAHKLRNRIAHESNLTIDERTADRAVTAYGKALAVYLGSRSSVQS